MGKLSGCVRNMCGNQVKLISMLGLTGSFMLVELIVGNTTNSMALVADSFHMLSDVIAIIIAFVSVRMSPKRWKKNTYGWARAEVVGALVNAVFLFALCFSIFVQAIKRFMVIEPLKNPELILIVGGVGLAINLVGLLLFGHHGHTHGDGDDLHGLIQVENDLPSEVNHSHTVGDNHSHSAGDNQSHTASDNHSDSAGDIDGHSHGSGHGHSHDNKENSEKKKKEKKGGMSHGHSHGGDSGEQMNMTGVFLHIMADALGSVVVIISALVIWLTDWEYRDYLDPVLSLIIVILICLSSWPLLRDSTLVLLNSIPSHINLVEIQDGLINKTQVTSVHELHVWRLVGSRVVASCHLEVELPPKDISNVEYHMNTARQIKEYFHSHGIHSTTIQLEYTDIQALEDGCQVLCPKKAGQFSDVLDSCIDSSCCKNRKKSQENLAIDIKTQF